MPINLDLPLMDPRGRPIMRHRTAEEIAAAKVEAPPLEPGQPEPNFSLVNMTLAEACLDALLDHVVLDDAGKPKPITGAEKFARYELATRIKSKESAVTLNATDIKLLESIVGSAFGPAAVGAIWTAIRERS